ncbi:hypothetical protein GCM10009117_20230 [Gangjinia marincola]|uniref:beta-fructofuranosidase n=1 Tax=Gangjinia marincola TaxID=578463 RepID=A0ABP3XUC1_9FLAO
MNNLYQSAITRLKHLAHEQGFLASGIALDNYKRVWARDSVICGLAGLLTNEEELIVALKDSLLSLAKHQNEWGCIPSNVPADSMEKDVSYGSLVGRVDTTTWFIIGACLYYKKTGDQTTWETLIPIIRNARKYLNTIELNNKGWLYTPLSGNWADEYPIHGYTLYDNILRLWGERLWLELCDKDTSDFEAICEKTRLNFWPSAENQDHLYHLTAYQKVCEETTEHFCSFVLPGKYDIRFDAAGNALALLFFRVSEKQKKAVSAYIDQLKLDISASLIPAFWPPVTPQSKDWSLLQHNYSYDFKNHPHHFHNGGIWPVWMGLFCLGLAHQGMQQQVDQIIKAFLPFTEKEDWNFNEYITSDHLELAGKEDMGFTASGIVFMHHARQGVDFAKILGL